MKNHKGDKIINVLYPKRLAFLVARVLGSNPPPAFVTARDHRTGNVYRYAAQGQA